MIYAIHYQLESLWCVYQCDPSWMSLSSTSIHPFLFFLLHSSLLLAVVCNHWLWLTQWWMSLFSLSISLSSIPLTRSLSLSLPLPGPSFLPLSPHPSYPRDTPIHLLWCPLFFSLRSFNHYLWLSFFNCNTSSHHPQLFQLPFFCRSLHFLLVFQGNLNQQESAIHCGIVSYTNNND